MKPPLRIHGVVPPVPTPLTPQGEIDRDAFHRIFDHLAHGGAHAAFVLGSTGELASLSPNQRTSTIQTAVQASAGRLPVIVGIADTCVATSIALAQQAQQLGASAVVATAPFYYELSPDELRQHFETLLPHIELPVLLYNMPWLTGHVIDADCLKTVLQFPQVIGFKDSSGDLAYLAEMIRLSTSRPEVTVLVGNEYLYLDALQLGAHGVVGGGANIYPSLFRQLQEAHLRGDHATATLCQQKITRLGSKIFDITGRPTSVFAAIKAAMSCLGLCSPLVAPPLTTCTPSQLDSLRLILSGRDLDAILHTVPAVA